MTDPAETQKNSRASLPPSEDSSDGSLAGPTIIPDAEIERLRSLGVDIDDPSIADEIAFIASQVSVSESPYPSADILEQYENFRPGLSERIIERIDRALDKSAEQRLLLHDRQERRKDRAQWSAIGISFFGLIVAPLTAYFTDGWVVPSIIAIISVGGPNAAMVLARYLDRIR
jgi:uncharacterized membrane protein